MKKLISTILALSLIFTTMAFSSLTANASSTTYDYGTMLYEENFDSALNTTVRTNPYWSLAGSVSDGALTLSSANNLVFADNKLPTANSGEKLIIDMRVKLSSVSTNSERITIYTTGAAINDSTRARAIKLHTYGSDFIANDNRSNLIATSGKSGIETTWYSVKCIYDPAVGKWDILSNGKCVAKNTSSTSSLKNAKLALIGFGANVSLDYIKVYSTKNIVSLDFDETKEEGSFYSATITKTNGNVSLTTEDGHGCLLLETPANVGTTGLELSIPSVYATTDKPYIVAEGRFKSTDGFGKTLLTLGSTAAITQPSAHQIASLRQYNDFLFIVDNENKTSKEEAKRVKTEYDYDSWVFVQIIADTTNPANVTFDVVVDGVLVQNDLVAVAQSSDNINKLTFIKTSAGASKLFVDYVNVYNATEAIVSDILYQGKTSFESGETAALSSVVKDNSATEITGKEVTYSLKESYDGVAISDGTITVADSAETGFFTVVASTQANGVEYSEEIDMRVVSSENPYKVLSSSVTNAAVSFELADVSPSGADLWTAIAVYNSDTSLKKVIVRTPSFEKHVWSDNVSLNGIAEQGDLVKVFFWNSLSQMKPYFAELD